MTKRQGIDMVAEQVTSPRKLGGAPAEGDVAAATQRIEGKLDVLMQLIFDGKIGYGVRAAPKKAAAAKTPFARGITQNLPVQQRVASRSLVRFSGGSVTTGMASCVVMEEKHSSTLQHCMVAMQTS